MPYFPLTQTRRNTVLGAIGQAGLDAVDFVWDIEPSEATVVGLGGEPVTVDVLEHRPTEYWFKFDVDATRASLWAIFIPGRDGVLRREHAGTWDYVRAYIQEWLLHVREEHDAPDLWAALGQQRELMVGEVAENTQFTPQEQAQIAAQLTEAKEYVRANFWLDPEQQAKVEAQLDYLIDAATRSRRIDWRNLLMGALVSQALQAVLPVDVVQQVLFVVLRGLAQMFGGGDHELPGAPPELT